MVSQIGSIYMHHLVCTPQFQPTFSSTFHAGPDHTTGKFLHRWALRLFRHLLPRAILRRADCTRLLWMGQIDIFWPGRQESRHWRYICSVLTARPIGHAWPLFPVGSFMASHLDWPASAAQSECRRYSGESSRRFMMIKEGQLELLGLRSLIVNHLDDLKDTQDYYQDVQDYQRRPLLASRLI